MANSKNLSFIEPKQERSKKRFEEVLKTAEFIYTHQENYALTVQDVSKLTGMKRPSIISFFQVMNLFLKLYRLNTRLIFLD